MLPESKRYMLSPAEYVVQIIMLHALVVTSIPSKTKTTHPALQSKIPPASKDGIDINVLGLIPFPQKLRSAQSEKHAGTNVDVKTPVHCSKRAKPR